MLTVYDGTHSTSGWVQESFILGTDEKDGIVTAHCKYCFIALSHQYQYQYQYQS